MDEIQIEANKILGQATSQKEAEVQLKNIGLEDIKIFKFDDDDRYGEATYRGEKICFWWYGNDDEE